MTENLVPTRIVNRNGVQTTVYRKPGRVLRQASAIPAPAGSTASELTREELLDDLSLKVRAICREQYSGANDVDQPTILRTLTGYSTGTLRRLNGFLLDSSWQRSGSKPSVVGHAVGRGEGEEFISDSMNFLPAVGKSSLIRSLRHYPQFRDLPVDDIAPDSELYRQALAVMDTADFIRYTFESNYQPGQQRPYQEMKIPGVPSFQVLTDERIVDLIMERYEDTGRIKDIVTEHQSAEYEVIVAALDNGAALGDGTL